MHSGGPYDKLNPSDSEDGESNYLLCCYFKLYNNSLLKSVCLIDMVFYLVMLTFNLAWTTIEVFGKASLVGADNLVFYVAYTSIMVGNLVLLVYSIHFKVKYRKFNMLMKNCYFEAYFYMRIAWGLISSLTSAGIFVYMLSIKPAPDRERDFNKFKQVSNMFCIVYVLYALFCFASSRGFQRSWYGLTNKDINFYFS